MHDITILTPFARALALFIPYMMIDNEKEHYNHLRVFVTKNHGPALRIFFWLKPNDVAPCAPLLTCSIRSHKAPVALRTAKDKASLSIGRLARGFPTLPDVHYRGEDETTEEAEQAKNYPDSRPTVFEVFVLVSLFSPLPLSHQVALYFLSY